MNHKSSRKTAWWSEFHHVVLIIDSLPDWQGIQSNFPPEGQEALMSSQLTNTFFLCQAKLLATELLGKWWRPPPLGLTSSQLVRLLLSKCWKVRIEKLIFILELLFFHITIAVCGRQASINTVSSLVWVFTAICHFCRGFIFCTHYTHELQHHMCLQLMFVWCIGSKQCMQCLFLKCS